MRKAIYAAIIGLMVAGCSSSGSMGSSTASADKTYTFQIKPTQGQAFNYDLNMTGAQNMTMSMAMTATKVEGDQSTFDTKITNMTMNGQPAPAAATAMMQQMTIEQVMDKTGKTISSKMIGAPAGTPESNTNAVTTAAFPDHPVKVGDTWTGTTNKTTATYKFVSVTNEGGKEVANLEVTLGANPQITPDGPMKLAFDTATGMPVNMSMSGTAMGQKIAMTMKQTN